MYYIQHAISPPYVCTAQTSPFAAWGVQMELLVAQTINK